VIPILAIDARIYADDRPITARLRERYARTVRGGDAKFSDLWLTYVDAGHAVMG
jgi:hypothetical protein